jgi:hypothetical protein
MAHELDLAFSQEKIVGWRVWRVVRPVERRVTAAALADSLLAAERRGKEGALEELFQYRLRSLTEHTLWPGDGRFEASCMLASEGEHDAPGVECECGIWAFRERGPAESTAVAYEHSGGAVAYGRVALWGRVVEHEHGWRGQYATPIDLWVCGAGDEAGWELVDAYDIPVELASWPEADPQPLTERR